MGKAEKVSELPIFVNLRGWLWHWPHRIRLAQTGTYRHDVRQSRHLRQTLLEWHDKNRSIRRN
jgi:hypothetical protein